MLMTVSIWDRGQAWAYFCSTSQILCIWPCGSHSTSGKSLLIPQRVCYWSVFQWWFVVKYGNGEIVWKHDLLGDHIKEMQDGGVRASVFYMLCRIKCTIFTSCEDLMYLFIWFLLSSCLPSSFSF